MLTGYEQAELGVGRHAGMSDIGRIGRLRGQQAEVRAALVDQVEYVGVLGNQTLELKIGKAPVQLDQAGLVLLGLVGIRQRQGQLRLLTSGQACGMAGKTVVGGQHFLSVSQQTAAGFGQLQAARTALE